MNLFSNIFKKKKNDEYKDLSDNIVKNKNVSLFKSLNKKEFDQVLIKLQYDYFCYIPFEKLNHEQRVLYLCMSLEDACQADTIFSLYEDGIMLQMPAIYDALMEIGAPKTAKLVKEFINLLPENTFKDMKLPDQNWFWETFEREEQIGNIDREISNYPDGNMREIYYQYVMKDDIAEKLFKID